MNRDAYEQILTLLNGMKSGPDGEVAVRLEYQVRAICDKLPPSLFRPNWTYTDEALDFCEKAREALQPLFDEKIAAGYSPRELAVALHSVVAELEAMAAIDRGVKEGFHG